MKKITRMTSLMDLAMIVCGQLEYDIIDAVLTGGAVVSIYTDNQYESFDLDFITHSPVSEVTKSLSKIGFTKTKGRYYSHSDSEFFVEFPSPPVAVGNRPLKRFNEIRSDLGYLKLLTPTQCVMDRLAALYYWNDIPSLEQAVLVTKSHKIDFDVIKKWSLEERKLDEFELFIKMLENE